MWRVQLRITWTDYTNAKEGGGETKLEVKREEVPI
jgi:hypothetical protein